ncbi:MSHA pilin protein MshC [Desulfuromusa kysingii]|uniref:Type II secretion system protein H n=1 Tax=Desulfuromusa kysingii TaxID=37625 RepID=A0A1H3WSQ0_9BACT|nr:prepilin-type N-terminal cleavage/methylation domain-containing protein [Desulfuromusa kysingii]SDZ90159.1 MSHA pilin protein MshC [Desulfuromusa kysingii]
MNKSYFAQWYNKGFTLVELVVILLLLGILSAVALPKFFNLSGYQDRAAYDELVDAVRYAQKLAVASGCDVQVDISANSYALQQHATNCTTGAFATITSHPFTSNVIKNVNLLATPGRFIFDAMGRSDSDVSVVINGGSYSFNVVAETGYVDAP